jgi:hypothetical protein
MSNSSGGDKPNYVRRQFDDAQRSRMDVEGFWKSSRGALTAVIAVAVIVVAFLVNTVFNFIG